MTRTAKRGPDNKKRHEASTWNTLKPQTWSPSPDGSWKAKADKGYKHKGVKGKQVKHKTGEEKLLHMILSKDKRREDRRIKRAKERALKKVCFKCRLPGHKVEDCIMTDSQQGTGLCYRCGSTEHKSSACKAKVAQGQMPFATCYVCGKSGHIAKSCPDNPKGLYPLGGGCKTCGSVEHFQRDCPEYLEKQGISSMKLKKISQGVSVDAVDDEEDVASNNKVQPHKVRKKKSIVISF